MTTTSFGSMRTEPFRFRRRVLKTLLVPIAVVSVGLAIDGQETPSDFMGMYPYWMSEHYGECANPDGSAYSTPETGDQRCNPQTGSCVKHFIGGADLTTGQCLHCAPNTAWDKPQKMPHDMTLEVSAAKVISLKAYGDCTSTGAASGQTCIECPLFFCAKFRLYFGTCPETCDATSSEVFAIARNSTCDPGITP